MDQTERRDAQKLYIADGAVFEQMQPARRLMQAFNTADRTDFGELKRILTELLPHAQDAMINPPFYCDYGNHIYGGRNLFMNYNCTILDVARVVIGDNFLAGPSVSIYTAGHPLHPETRGSGYEYGLEVVIGDNVWVGGGAIICPGVTIGSNVVIGAGSVVTKDIPDWSFAAGNPCRVIRKITEEDRWLYGGRREADPEGRADIERILREKRAES